MEELLKDRHKKVMDEITNSKQQRSEIMNRLKEARVGKHS
jgi:hypothetical protein